MSQAIYLVFIIVDVIYASLLLEEKGVPFISIGIYDEGENNKKQC